MMKPAEKGGSVASMEMKPAERGRGGCKHGDETYRERKGGGLLRGDESLEKGRRLPSGN